MDFWKYCDEEQGGLALMVLMVRVRRTEAATRGLVCAVLAQPVLWGILQRSVTVCKHLQRLKGQSLCSSPWLFMH